MSNQSRLMRLSLRTVLALVCASFAFGAEKKRLCGECFAPGQQRWTYCERCGGRLVDLSQPESRPPRLLKGGKRYDLTYKHQTGDSFSTYVDTVTDVAQGSREPHKRFMNLQITHRITEVRGAAACLELCPVLKNLVSGGKNLTAERAKAFADRVARGAVTDNGKPVPGSLSAQDAQLLAQAIVPLPLEPVARKDTWTAESVFGPGDCTALLPELFHGVATRVNGRFVLAAITVKSKKKCAQIVGHFTIHAKGRKRISDVPVELTGAGEYEYVAYFAIDQGHIVSVEAAGYIKGATQAAGKSSNISAKVQLWATTKKETPP